MAYYEIIFGSGFYDCYRYVVKTDYPTTIYGALIDALIDYLKEKGHSSIITDWDYIGSSDNIAYIGTDGNVETLYYDEFIVGGNCGDVLQHHGIFCIKEITENEIRDAEIVEV